MPYDEELARIRAQMLANQDDEPPVFDDGARYRLLMVKFKKGKAYLEGLDYDAAEVL